MYLDTRLILQKLEALYPPSEAHPPLSAQTGEHAAIERLLSRYATDGGLFCKPTVPVPVPVPGPMSPSPGVIVFV